MERFSAWLSKVSLGVRVIFIAGSLLAVLAGAYTTSKAVLAVPAKLDKHDSTSTAIGNEQTELLKKMLCIQVANQRKMTWTLCYTHPREVMDP